MNERDVLLWHRDRIKADKDRGVLPLWTKHTLRPDDAEVLIHALTIGAEAIEETGYDDGDTG